MSIEERLAAGDEVVLFTCLALVLILVGFLGVLNTLTKWWDERHPGDPYDF